jgi:alpha-tubulin suppressor-like RCC1 family protein
MSSCWLCLQEGERIVKAGKTGYDLEYPPRKVQGLENKKIVQIASGNQHSLAMDEDGYVWAWGYAGYSRLGLQDQKDRCVYALGGADTQASTSTGSFGETVQ